jgi:hypothetical protein
MAELAEAVVLSFEDRPDDADARFERALGTLRRFKLAGEEADALHQWGLALARAGERAAAEARLEEAAEVYRRIGAGAPWLERVSPRRPGGGPSPRPGRASPTSAGPSP